MSEPIAEPSPPSPEQLAAWAEAEREAERELAAADAAATTAHAPPEAAAPASPQSPAGGAPRVLLFAGLVLLTVGSSVGSALVFWSKPVPEPEAEHHAPAPAADPLGPAASDPLIRAGSYTEALALCERAFAELPKARHLGIAYREALCLEALGRFKDADGAYRRAEPATGDRAAWACAVLGQARCAVARGDLSAARSHLDRVALRAGHPDCAGTRVASECAIMRAEIDALGCGAVRAMDPFAPTALAWPPLGGGGDKYLDWLPPDAPGAASGGPAAPDTARVHALPGHPGAFEATAHLAERPVAQVVRALAAAAGLKLDLGEAAAKALQESAVVDVEAVPLSELLDALVAGHGFGWTIAGDRLTVAPGGPAHDRAAALRSLRRAVEAIPKPPEEGAAAAAFVPAPWAEAARVWLANFEFEAGRTREAARAYQRLVESAPEAPEVPYAVYNLGLVDLSAGALPSARSRFVDLVDRAPRSRWADYGWWWVGRTHFDAGDFAAAGAALQSARRGRTGEVASAAALGACALELLDGTEARARAALDGHRGDARPQHAALRAALEAVLRYRAAPTPGRRTALLDALRASNDGAALGPGGTFFAGLVYRDLGQTERTVALFDAASLTTRGPLAHRMTYTVAEWYDVLGRPDEARQRYLAIAATDPAGLGPSAHLRLAEMALRERKADECLGRCRALLKREGIDRAAVLALMGRGYELQRNFRAAAECFSGRVPAE